MLDNVTLPPLDWATMVGFGGMILIVGAYAYMTAKQSPNPFILHGTNLSGAVLLTISLLVHMNLPSLMLEAVWISISIWGLIKAFSAKSKNPSEIQGK